ncbi:alpha/beta hydrolase [Lactobacillus ultunensis]|nr:alpha/beta fold hydrolase [Lactobacillus ultunensis]QQP27651.1 DUF1749 domain-containing protein [Lactobacillus ultunensis]
MKYEALNVYTKKGTELTGVLFSEKKSDWLMIAITGVHGNFYSNPFYVNIGQTLNENEIDFLYAQTRDAFGQIESNNKVTGKKEIIGSFNEDFNEADNDIEAYLDFAQKHNYHHVILAGHSLGANKVIHYLATHDDSRVDHFIFLSPANVRYLTSYLSNAEKQEIMDKVKNGQGEEMLSFSMFGWLPAKARTAEQWLNSPVIDNVHSGDAGDFSQLENIHKTGALLIGTYDTFTEGDPSSFLKNINNHMPTKDKNQLIFIKETGHTYQEKEQEVAEKIASIIKNWQKEKVN